MKKWYSLIDKIYRKENLELAFKRVKRNNGVPGIDGETVSDYAENLERNTELLYEKLKTNKYEPSPIRRVEIEKPDGGVRLLGVPTVKDRVVQQAIVNIIEPIYDATFHPSSYGYRPKRSQHETVAEQISDGKVLELIRKFLKSGVMDSENFVATEIGSCQGGVISSGDYRAYATKILEEELKLTVNQKKTKLTNVRDGVEFLGFVIGRKFLTISPKRIKCFKDKVRAMTKRGIGRKLEDIIKELNPVLRGWMNYYRVATIKGLVTNLMGWIRRRLRMLKMKQWKTYKKMHKEMRKLGIKGTGEKMAIRKWKNSNVHIIHMLLPNKYFHRLGLIDLCDYEVGLLSNYY